jgi:hypothetical protein
MTNPIGDILIRAEIFQHNRILLSFSALTSMGATEVPSSAILLFTRSNSSQFNSRIHNLIQPHFDTSYPRASTRSTLFGLNTLS